MDTHTLPTEVEDLLPIECQLPEYIFDSLDWLGSGRTYFGRWYNNLGYELLKHNGFNLDQITI